MSPPPAFHGDTSESLSVEEEAAAAAKAAPPAGPRFRRGQRLEWRPLVGRLDGRRLEADPFVVDVFVVVFGFIRESWASFAPFNEGLRKETSSSITLLIALSPSKRTNRRGGSNRWTTDSRNGHCQYPRNSTDSESSTVYVTTQLIWRQVKEVFEL